MKASLPPFLIKLSVLASLAGGLIGVVISWNNGDDLGWSLLRGAVLFLIFGGMTRLWLKAMAKAWLESRLEILKDRPSPK